MSFKQVLLSACINQVDTKISTLQQAIKELAADSENDSKSSVGDKHEVGRAMLQNEQEKLGKQLLELNQQKVQLERLPVSTVAKKISIGSLITTNKGTLFLAIALGRINVNGQEVIALSPQSPLGQQLVGLAVGGVAHINQMAYQVLAIE